MPGHIPEQTIEDIRNRADIVDIVNSYTPVKKRGNDFWTLCPFHREKTPSFKISPARQAFYCFGCKKSGNVFHFIQEKENVDFVGAVRLLAQRVGVRIPEPAPRPTKAGSAAPPEPRAPKERLYTLLDRIGEWYHSLLSTPEAETARRYVEERGLPAAVVNEFQLGYAPDSWDAALRWGERHGYDAQIMLGAGLLVPREDATGPQCYDRFRARLMFPIRDELGRVVGFSARALRSDAKAAKYINTPETALFRKNRLLYGLHLARQALKEYGHALICEGQLDVIACHRAGVKNAVAPQGTAFTENHARLLKRFTGAITLAFDADAAGEKAAVRTIDIAHAAGLRVRVAILPEGQDPDGIFRTQGAEALQRIMQDARDAFAFLLDLAGRRHGTGTPEGKAAIVREVLDSVAAIVSPVSRAANCQWLSRKVGLPEAAVFETLNRNLAARRRQVSRAPAEEPGQPSPAAAARTLSMTERVHLTLFDLALHHGFIAHDLLQRLPPDSVDDTPAGKALNLVIALTAEGEWAQAAKEVSADQTLAADPAIARVLVGSSFKHLDPEHAAEHERDRMEEQLEKAVSDCLRKLEVIELDRQIEEHRRELQNADDPEKMRELQRRFNDLAVRRENLKRGSA